MAKTTPWTKIKKEYLEGTAPKELAEKYKLDINKIYDKIDNAKWAKELKEINGNVRNDVQDRISKLTNKALQTLEEVIDDYETEKNIKVQACKALLDISGLKSSKQEISGVGGATVIINREAVHVESNN